MNEILTIIIAVIGGLLTWTATVAAVIIWLEKRFTRLETYIRRDLRALEVEIRREMQVHHDDDDDKFYDHGTRIQRLEIDAFGVTHSGMTRP